MANRQRARREVTNVVPDLSQAHMFNSIAAIGKTVQAMQEKKDVAKMNDYLADSQIQMIEATNNWRVENEADPTNPQALQKLNKSYDDILGGYNDKIGIMSRPKWIEASKKIKNQSKLNNIQWGVKKEVANAEGRINSSIEKNLDIAVGYGTSGDTEAALMNYDNSKQALEAFGTGILSDQKIATLTKDFKSDYMKSFISGVASADPTRALELLKTDEVKNDINNTDHVKMLETMANKELKDIDRKKKILQRSNKTKVTSELVKDSNAYTINELQLMEFKEEVPDGYADEAIAFKTKKVYSLDTDYATSNRIDDMIDGELRKRDGSLYSEEEIASEIMSKSDKLEEKDADALVSKIDTVRDKMTKDTEKLETAGLNATLNQTIGGKFTEETFTGTARGKIEEYLYNFHKQIVEENATPTRIKEIASEMKARIIQASDPNFVPKTDENYNQVHLIRPNQTAINPTTGEKLILTDDGRWVQIEEGYKGT